MGFDASKLVVGKKYPMRNLGSAEFVRSYKNHIDGMTLVWLHCLGGDSFGQCFTTNARGQQAVVTLQDSGMDIISDEPIKEPVEMTVPFRFAVFDRNGGFCGHWRTMQRAMSEAAMIGNAVGVYELPEKILVTPK